MDETVNEEIIEEIIEKTVPQKELENNNDNNINNDNDSKDNNDNIEVVKTDKPVLIDTKTENIDWKPLPPPEEESIKIVEEKKIETKPINEQVKQESDNVKLEIKEKTPKNSILSFNDNDSVLDLGTNKESIIQAPKTPERLEKISKEQHEKRKAEEAEEEDDDEKLTIFDSVDLKLDSLDVNNLEKKLDTRPDPILNDIEILS